MCYHMQEEQVRKIFIVSISKLWDGGNSWQTIDVLRNLDKLLQPGETRE